MPKEKPKAEGIGGQRHGALRGAMAPFDVAIRAGRETDAGQQNQRGEPARFHGERFPAAGASPANARKPPIDNVAGISPSSVCARAPPEGRKIALAD